MTQTMTIPKMRQGDLTFTINYPEKWLALCADPPAKGTKGASFSQERISFDTINTILRQGCNKSSDLMDCFATGSTINCGTMLAAILVHLGCLDRKYQTLTYLP